MKKKLLIITIILIFIIFLYLIIGKISFNNYLNSTINYEKKINYSTNINMSIKTKITNSKINYDIIKSSNIKKIILENYVDNKIDNKIQKYIVKEKNKESTYVYNGKTYDKQEKNEEIININYTLLKKSKIKSYNLNTYKIKMKAYDAYNLVYKKQAMKKNNLNYDILVYVKMDKNNKFIKEISYTINNLNNSNDENQKIKYQVKIVNSDINNHNELKLPF